MSTLSQFPAPRFTTYRRQKIHLVLNLKILQYYKWKYLGMEFQVIGWRVPKHIFTVFYIEHWNVCWLILCNQLQLKHCTMLIVYSILHKLHYLQISDHSLSFSYIFKTFVHGCLHHKFCMHIKMSMVTMKDCISIGLQSTNSTTHI